MLMFTELPCGIEMNSCSYVLDLLTRGPLHLLKGWASVWSRPSHLLMCQPVSLLLWSMAASKTHISGVALQEVCDMAGWSSPHTFIRFYSLDLDSTPGSQVLSSECCSLDFTPDRHSSLWWGYINVPLKHQNRRNRVPLKGNVRLQL